MKRHPPVKPCDRPTEVRIFLAAIANGEAVKVARRYAGLGERQILRWIAFHDFLPLIEEARARANLCNRDTLVDFLAALAERSIGERTTSVERARTSSVS